MSGEPQSRRDAEREGLRLYRRMRRRQRVRHIREALTPGGVTPRVAAAREQALRALLDEQPWLTRVDPEQVDPVKRAFMAVHERRLMRRLRRRERFESWRRRLTSWPRKLLGPVR